MSIIRESLNSLIEGRNLTEDQAASLMNEIMSGSATDAQIAALITALRIKGETVDEVTGFARVMREKATPVSSRHHELLDTCGTGGDGSQTFNISTTVAFVAASLGVPVAKHGNRSVSSRSGSADLLEALGVNINLTPEQVGECIDHLGIGFLFAPKLHGAMKYAIGPRKEIGIRTVFNLLGPLTNPAGAQYQVMGVYAPELTEYVAKVLAKLGTRSACVVHGAGGLDEVSTMGQTRVSEVKDGEVITYYINPEKIGIPVASHAALRGGTPLENADITKKVLMGEKGAARDIVLANTALALKVTGKASTLTEGLRLAKEAIDSGAALDKMYKLVDFSSRLSAGSQVS